MGKIRRVVVLLSAVILFSINSYGGARDAVFYHDIRSLAMGGVGVVSAKGSGSFIYNPALLNRLIFKITIPNIRFELNDRLFDLINFVNENMDSLSSFSNLTPAGQNRLYMDMSAIDNKWMRLGLPNLMVSLAIKNIGVGIYTTTDFNIKIDKGIYEPRLYARGVNDLVITGGIAKGLGFLVPGLTAGLSLKLINRRDTGEIKLGFAQIESAADMVKEIGEELERGEAGFGVDVGALYKLGNKRTELGIVIQDLIGSIEGYEVSSNLKIGAQHKLLPGLTMSGEIHDFFNTNGDALFNKVHFGAEVDLPFLDLRAGVNQGYPTLGFGLNLLIMRIDFAYYSRELGRVPGQDQENVFALVVDVGL